MFVISGRATDITFTRADDGFGISGDITFSLKGRQLRMTVYRSASPIEVSSGIIVAVEPQKDGSLHAIACYVKNTRAFVDDWLTLKLSAIGFIVSGLLYLPPISLGVEYSRSGVMTIAGLLLVALGIFVFFVTASS